MALPVKPFISTAAPPRSYEEIIARAEFPSVQLSAKLFLPDKSGRLPVVIIVPGSSGVGNSATEHAEALTSADIAVLVVDPFGARSVTSTVANQGQFSFAASSYDVLAAAKYLSMLPEIDRARIGALGYSRGGTAVIQAAVSPLANAVLGQEFRCGPSRRPGHGAAISLNSRTPSPARYASLWAIWICGSLPPNARHTPR
jgi:dienelactone hydrolase